MVAEPTADLQREQQLDELIAAYLDQAEAGQTPNVDEWLDRHPDFKTELAAFFADRIRLERLAAPLRTIAHPVDHVDSPGRLGDFRIVREIGRGGMGVVYEAEQISLGRRVALKVLPFAAMLDHQQLARFKNEARAAATLDHPNIVAVFSVGVDRGVHYYAMQLIEGQSLAQVVEQMRSKQEVGAASRAAPSDNVELTQSGPARLAGPTADTAPVASLSTLHAPSSSLPDFSSRDYFRTIAQLGIQAAEALDHAHQNGVLHRDIKPANLLLDDTGKLWITDFGLARMEQDAGMTMTGDILGTLRYMSPEQALAKRVVVDHRSDIYSLGVTLYELFTLQPAFTGDDRQELLRQIAFEEPKAPRKIRANVPQDLETVVVKAIEKNPADRYATARELADDLNRFLDNRPIVARAPSLAHRARKWAGRHVALISISSAALTFVTLACIAAALFTLQAYSSEAQHRAAAEDNLVIASDSIDEMIARVANDQYFHGDLAHAEILAADATKFYERLLKHSDNPDLRFRAAETHEKVAGIWVLVGQYEKARMACLRSIELVRPLINSNVGDGRYLNARGAAYLMLTKAEWGFDGSSNAEEPCAQAVADFQLLVDRFSHEPKYQGSLSNALNNLGLICWIGGRGDQAERYFEQSMEILDRLPKSVMSTPQGWTARAGTLCNWAMALRERDDTKRAMQLLDEAIALQKRSLDEWPTNPVAADYLFNHYWHLGETGIRAGQHTAAAKAVEILVWACSDQLRTYHYGAEQLLQCAELAEAAMSNAERMSDADSVKRSEMPPPSELIAPADAYRRRAQELVALAHNATNRTPDMSDRFAWFLLTCQDASLRNPSRALELAMTVVREVPKRGDPWLTLALAHYRLNDWQAADDAVQKAIELPHMVAATSVCDWLLLAMIRHQQGRSDEEAGQWHKKARDQLATDKTDVEHALCLAAETDQLLATRSTQSSGPITSQD